MSLAHLVQQWERNAQQYPDKTCAVDLGANETISWSMMQERVVHIQQMFSAQSLTMGDRIALTMPAGIDWIASVWACWKLGLCWCPLPPNVPEQRRNTQLQFGEFHASFDGTTVLPLNNNARKSPKQSAYLIFTSGTTGAPKGVLVGDSGLINLWNEQCKWFEITPESCCAWMLSPSFDASLSDIGVALTAAATLIIVPQQRWKYYRTWKQDMEQHHITHLDAPPSLLALWENKPIPSSLEVVIAGGEPTPPSLLAAWSHKVKWMNVYGPTETTVCSSIEQRRVDAIHHGLSTIGCPISNVVYAIDGNLTEGELLIGGDCVALEYWNNPILTNEKFIVREGIRWFRSGDFVRKIDDNYLYCGRLDRQIKRNGQLINLDEIESVLSQCLGVGQVIVLLKDNQLFTVHCSGKDNSILLDYAKTHLPSWGVPNKVVALSQWPLTQHNKIDRTQLEKSLEIPRTTHC